MDNENNFRHSFTVNVPAEEVLEYVNRVPDWWATNFEGSSNKLHDIFTVRFGDVTVDFMIIEFIPDRKIVWLVTDCNLDWLDDKKEWKDTKIVWEVMTIKNLTQLSMTHEGLVPELECYEDCKEGWNFHVGESLFRLITEGIGMPDVNTRE